MGVHFFQIVLYPTIICIQKINWIFEQLCTNPYIMAIDGAASCENCQDSILSCVCQVFSQQFHSINNDSRFTCNTESQINPTFIFGVSNTTNRRFLHNKPDIEVIGIKLGVIVRRVRGHTVQRRKMSRRRLKWPFNTI
jgi:hypothetical protein